MNSPTQTQLVTQKYQQLKLKALVGKNLSNHEKGFMAYFEKELLGKNIMLDDKLYQSVYNLHKVLFQ